MLNFPQRRHAPISGVFDVGVSVPGMALGQVARITATDGGQ